MNTRAEQINEASRRVLEPGSDLFKPLQLISVENNRAGDCADVQLELAYRGRPYCFFVEIKTRTAPSVVKEVIRDLSKRDPLAGCYPLLMVPYLSQTIVNLLEEANISGIDLNGNYLIQLPDFVAIRLDRKNRYTESGDIKKVYSGNSSIVGRFLLKENRPYKQVTEIFEGIERCGGGISLSTVSKVLTALKEDLIIEKRSYLIQVLQADELLARLQAGYRVPKVSTTLKLKLPEDLSAKEDILHENLGRDAWVWDGATSVAYYTVTTPFGMATAYTRADARTMDHLRAYENDRFYNCVVKQTRQAFVYFDRQASWSSPVECYLALMQLDKREREIAQPLKDDLLRFFPR